MSDQARLLAYARHLLPEDALESSADPPWAGVEGVSDGVTESLAKHLHGDQGQLTQADLGALEAIILPRQRPPLVIRDGSFDEPSPPWSHLDEAGARALIHPALAAVGRVEVPTLDIPYGGTAFLVAPNLLMTNWHVARLFIHGTGLHELLYTPGDAAIDFLAEAGSPAPVPIEVLGAALVHPYWDAALLRIAAAPAGIAPLSLSLIHPDDLVGREVAVVGYPAVDPRNNVAVQNRVFGGLFNVKRLQPGKIGKTRDIPTSRHRVRAMTHDASTLGGNSGSVVMDLTTGHVVGLHFAGRYLDANFAVPCHALGQDSRFVDTGVQFANPAPGGDAHDSLWRQADPEPEAPPVMVATAAPAPTKELAPTEKPDPDYDNRRGYNPEFLAGHVVALPELSQRHQADIATNGWAQGGDRADLLDYTHFTLCMSRSRRLPFYTAVNLHGGLIKRVERGSDRWFFDPRLPRSLHVGPDHYVGNDLDRGHLVRRLDPVWGHTMAEAKQANTDTFHYTNAAPQHLDLNRNRGSWAGVENFIYKLAKDAGARVSVFTGPVLRATDRRHRGVAVPEEFWKIVALVRPDGRLSASAYLLSQRDLIQGITESFVDLGKWAEFQVSIAFIERITGLSFGPLRTADPMVQPGAEESVRTIPIRRIGDDSPPLLDPGTNEGLFTGVSARISAPVMMQLAKQYNMAKRGENRWFNKHWRTVSSLARFDLSKKAQARHRETAFRMVDAAGPLLKEAINGAPRPVIGHQHVKRLPVKGRYVIFSDHHISHSAHRQNFFWKQKNMALYVAALDQYDDQDFTLIENGDVEELLIWDPKQYPEFMAERLSWKDLNDKEYEKTLPAKLIEQRLAVRYHLLDDILTDPNLKPWRDAIGRFDQKNKLIRVAGNHDYNLQGKSFLKRFQQNFPNVEQVYDYVFLERPDGHVQYAIMHGHQFDLTTNPASAPRFGETFSECVALWFQGGDRTWAWGEDPSKKGQPMYVPEPDDWASGITSVNNQLVEDNHEVFNPAFAEPGPEGPLDLPPGMDHLGDNMTAVLLRVAARQEGLEGVQQPDEEEGFEEGFQLLDKDDWEGIFGHSVAWEYFANNKPTAAILNEVFCGKRFFKYRHTNEQELARQLMLHFTDEERPTVIFGHTHEPRMNATIPTAFVQRLRDSGRPGDDEVADRLANMERFAWYANSAAAGRFERMIWAIEVDDGDMKLVSWASMDGPGGTQRVERRVWRTTAEGLLAQGNGHTPIPGGNS